MDAKALQDNDLPADRDDGPSPDPSRTSPGPQPDPNRTPLTLCAICSRSDIGLIRYAFGVRPTMLDISTGLEVANKDYMEISVCKADMNLIIKTRNRFINQYHYTPRPVRLVTITRNIRNTKPITKRVNRTRDIAVVNDRRSKSPYCAECGCRKVNGECVNRECNQLSNR